MATEPDKYEHHEYVVLPRGESKTGKPLVILNMLDANGKPIPDRLAFESDKLTRSWRVGQVYDIPTINGGKTFVVGRAEWLRPHEDAAQVATWQGEQAAADISRAAKAREKRQSSSTSTSELEKAFKILRCAYRGVPSTQRTAFDAYVLNQIRKG